MIPWEFPCSVRNVARISSSAPMYFAALDLHNQINWRHLTAAYGLNVVATYGIGAGGFKKMGLLSPTSAFRSNKEMSANHCTLSTPVSESGLSCQQQFPS